MKKVFLCWFWVFSSGIYAQNDTLQKERYEVINALYKNLDIEQYGKAVLDRNFLIYPGLGALMSDPELVDNLLGHCADFEKGEIYSYSDILNEQEISELHDQINELEYYKTIDSTLISDRIRFQNKNDYSQTAITIPLIFNNKAIVFLSNSSEETLLVLVKKDGDWIVRCRKSLFMVFMD